MKPYKIFNKISNTPKKLKVISPLKKIKIPLYFCNNISILSKSQIELPDQGDC